MLLRTNRVYRASRKAYDDPHIGAMQVQYAYAISCHKAQGGEWEKVLVLPYFPRNNTLKWIYTAITRASKELYSFKNNY